MGFTYLRQVLDSYLVRLGNTVTTNNEYISAFNLLEKAHHAINLESLDKELTKQVIEARISYLRLSGACNERIRRLERVFNSIILLLNGCSYDEFYYSIRGKYSSLLEEGLALTIEGYRDYLYSRKLNPETVAYYIRYVKKFLSYANISSTNELREISAKKIVDIVSEMLREYASVSRKLTAIRYYLKWLFEHKEIGQDFSLLIDFRTPRKRPLIRYFDKESLDALLANLSDKKEEDILIKAVIQLALTTGLRSVDIGNLKLSDIDWKLRTISIIQSKTNVKVTLPLLDAAAIPLSKYLLEVRPSIAREYVFCSSANGRPLKRRGISNLFSTYRNRILGEGYKGYGLHALRRTIGSSLFQNETDIGLIKDVLGHRDLSSLDRYMQADDYHLIECNLDLVGKILRKELSNE